LRQYNSRQLSRIKVHRERLGDASVKKKLCVITGVLLVIGGAAAGALYCAYPVKVSTMICGGTMMLVSITNTRHIATCFSFFVVLVMAIGCTAVLQPDSSQAPRVMLDTPNGPVMLGGQAQGGSAVAGSDLAMPPAGLDGMVPSPSRPASRSGTYAGAADVLSTGGGACLENRRVTNFRVRGDAVQFGEFNGTIGTDGGLQMVFRNIWITGQFRGETFRGQLAENGGIGCTYVLALERVGP
jgi:hypothetical protein